MKEDGAILVDGIQVASTHKCCHCGNHFVSIKGSGVTRGFCLKCQHVTCGHLGCDPCVPFEKQLEKLERSK